jgi:hypothetical protein
MRGLHARTVAHHYEHDMKSTRPTCGIRVLIARWQTLDARPQHLGQRGGPLLRSLSTSCKPLPGEASTLRFPRYFITVTAEVNGGIGLWGCL